MKKILIVDDRREIRELVEVTLRVGNFTILQAQSGQEAVKMTRSEKPDLILMYVMMPGKIDGFEASRCSNSCLRGGVIA